MARQRDPFWDFVGNLDEYGCFKCIFCGYKYSAATSVTRIKWHLSGVQGRGVKICRQMPEDVEEAAFQAVHGGNKRHKNIESSSNFNDNAILTTPQEQNNEVDSLAGDAGRIQAPGTMGQALERFLEEINNVMEDGTAGRLVQPGAGASSSGGLTGNTNETPGDPLPTSLHVEVDNNKNAIIERLERVTGQPVVSNDLSQPADLLCLGPGRHYDQLCSSSPNNDVIMNDVENMIRESGQPVVRGSSDERPLVNHDEPQEDSSQPTDPPCITHGRYHDQLCPPLVNMDGDPGQPVVRHSSREALQRNGDESGRDVFLTEELIGGEFENNNNAIWSWIMNDEASSSIGIYGMGGVGRTTVVIHIYNQPGAGASSSEGLTGNTNVAPQGQHLERVTGQPVVRGSSDERPLVNHNEPQEDSSQPTDPPCLTHGRYHDQLCLPQVNMVGDPGQPIVRHSSREALQRNSDESGRDVFLTEELMGGEFENNKNAIWSWIMNDEASSRIGIYGMAGVGKTTLLTHIYNQLLQEPGTFPHVQWIMVSQDFSVYKLQNLIARDILLDLSNEDNKRKRAAKLSKALIEKQRWVLILDDLWHCFDFDEVGIPIQVKGCKLILTTRSFEVCQRMVCQKTIKVEPLSMEEAWALFIKIRGCIPPEAEEIAKSMASECAGLPLGIKTVAGTMRGVDDICEWRNALEELKQSRVRQEDMDEKVSQILRFGYMHLESAVKQCFLYCSLFPEHFMIPREHLIAQLIDMIAYLIDKGVIKGLKSREAGFNKCHSMLNILERVCLLESSKNGNVKIHDLFWDILKGNREREGRKKKKKRKEGKIKEKEEIWKKQV